MKKLFTLAAAVLASFSLWADATHTAPATVSYAEKTFLDVANTPGNAGVDNEEYLNYGVQVMNNNYSSWAWFVISSGTWSKSNNAYTLPQGANGFCTPGTSSSSEFYGQINFKANDNSKTGQIDMYVTGLTEVGFVWKNNNTSSDRWMNYSVTEVASDGTLGTPRLKNGSTSSTNIQYDSIQGLEGTKYYKISMWTTGGSSSLVYTFTFKRYVAPSCNDPEVVLTLSKTSMFVGEQAHLEFTTKGTSEDWGIYVLKDGKTAKYGEDYSLSSYPAMYPVSIDVTPLTAGTFELTAFQESDGTYCAVDEKVTVTVNAANPVTAVTIDGPAAAYVGEELIYTATAANATAYEWYINEEKQGSDSAKLVVTAAKGSYSIVCKARNKFNDEKEWIASKAVELTVIKGSGSLISYIVNSDANGATSKNGIFSENATPKVSLTKGTSSKLTVDEIEYTGFKMDRGKYVGVTLSKGSFIIGDTVSFMITSATGSAKLYLYNDEQGTTRLDSIDGAGVTGWATFILNQPTKGVYLYRSNPDVKPYDQNPHVAAMKVIRPLDVKSTVVALANVKINDVAVAAADLTKLLADGSLSIEDDYLNAPVVKFFQETTITYEDDGKKVITDSVAVTASEVAGKWQAKTTVNKVEYTVTMAKTASYEVTYKLGTRTLGSELVAANGNPANYATYQDLKDGGLSTFGAWFSQSDLSGDAVTIASAVITKDTAFYASFTCKYAQSINIEQSIFANGKDSAASVALINSLGTLNYAKNISYKKNTNELDSLNDGKGAMRNYDYLGLKIKTAGAMLNLRLAEGKTVNIKFGNVAVTPLVAINGGDYAEMSLTNGVYTYTATGEDLVSIKTATDGAVVFKQIAIDKPLTDVMYPITYAETENGTIAGWKIALPGETVNLTATPADGYQLKAITVNAETLEPVDSKYSFTMPAKAVEVAATFETAPTAIGNTEAEVKAVKVIRNGQLIIIRDGKEFNVLGSQTK